jgi:hypothetical protein
MCCGERSNTIKRMERRCRVEALQIFFQLPEDFHESFFGRASRVMTKPDQAIRPGISDSRDEILPFNPEMPFEGIIIMEEYPR